MLKILSQNNTDLILNDINLEEIVKTIKDLSHSNDLITIDVSKMNLIDACKISTLISTEQYIIDNKIHINWLVASPLVEEMSKPLSLGNSTYIY